MDSSNRNLPRPPRHSIRQAKKTRQDRRKIKQEGISYSPQYKLALAILMLVGLAAIVAIVHPNGMAIFDKLLPPLMLVLGGFFPQREERESFSSDEAKRKNARRK